MFIWLYRCEAVALAKECRNQVCWIRAKRRTFASRAHSTPGQQKRLQLRGTWVNSWRIARRREGSHSAQGDLVGWPIGFLQWNATGEMQQIVPFPPALRSDCRSGPATRSNSLSSRDKKSSQSWKDNRNCCTVSAEINWETLTKSIWYFLQTEPAPVDWFANSSSFCSNSSALLVPKIS